MPSSTSVYSWRENQACVATYKVLEGDMFLDQFELSDISFSAAATVKMQDLRYFPNTTNNPDLVEVLSLEITRKFVKHLVKIFTIKKQNANHSSAEIIRSIAQVFEDGEKTIVELAAVVDEKIKFPDEQ